MSLKAQPIDGAIPRWLTKRQAMWYTNTLTESTFDSKFKDVYWYSNDTDGKEGIHLYDRLEIDKFILTKCNNVRKRRIIYGN